jgi:hypothetical protein
MNLTDLNQIIELKTKRLDGPELTEDHTPPVVFCPDCGAELQPRIHQQTVKPMQSNLYFYGKGRCHVEACSAWGMFLEEAPDGTPKFYVPLSDGPIELDQVMATEVAALEIEKIFGHQSYSFPPHDIILEVYNRIREKFKSVHFALDAIYTLGWVYGVRAERKRRSLRNQVP